MGLTENVKEFLELREQLRTVQGDIKSILEEDDFQGDIERKKKEIKELQAKQAAHAKELVERKEKKKDLKSRADLIKEIIVAELAEEQPSLPGTDVVGMEFEGYVFKIKEGLQIKRAK